mgnify:CR=1 FL=1
MKTMTADDLRAHALRTGSEVVIDGKPFNTQRAQIQPQARTLAKPAPVEPIAPPIPPQSTITREELERLLFEQEMRLQAMFQTAVTMLKATGKPSRARPTGVVPTYDQKGAITAVAFQYQQ